MLTRCPHCQTAFRVTTEQLKVRQGKVRCGECQAVFDALQSLADEAPLVIAGLPAVVEPLPEPAPADDIPVPAAEATEPEPSPPEPAIEPGPEFVEPAEPETEVLHAGPEAEATPPAAEAEAELQELPPAPRPQEEPMPEAWSGVEEVRPPRRWPWLLGALLLLLTAAGQALYIFRVEAAVLAPELRPLLVAGCDLLGCTLPRPRKPELVGIETSDLAPAGSDRLVLTALIKNRAPFEQEYPHLELTLTDRNDDTLLRKVLAPADYLPAAPSAGFAARDEAAVKLLLEAKGVAAVGYRLYLFYP
jgi:predicted Zn finger-like uncharacterized protein